jgi:hypothetical protein
MRKIVKCKGNHSHANLLLLADMIPLATHRMGPWTLSPASSGHANGTAYPVPARIHLEGLLAGMGLPPQHATNVGNDRPFGYGI